jgi:hypothetical protein
MSADQIEPTGPVLFVAALSWLVVVGIGAIALIPFLFMGGK